MYHGRHGMPSGFPHGAPPAPISYHHTLYLPFNDYKNLQCLDKSIIE